MIQNLVITNHLGESITLELRSPEKSGFLVRSVDGLGPSKASINITEISTSDGGVFNSSRVNLRNIVFSLSFLPMPTIEDTRQKSYKYFPIKRRIGIQIETDNRICETYGYVESNEPDIFSSEEGATISVICPGSYLYSLETNVTIFSTKTPSFEFPFSSEMAGGTIPERLLEFGEIDFISEKNISYTGDAPTGITITIHATGSVTNLRIINVQTREEISILDSRLAYLTGFGIVAGDDIFISTVKGNKYVLLQRNGEIINILNALDRNIGWFQLERGDNLFTYLADSGASNAYLRIENSIVNEGI